MKLKYIFLSNNNILNTFSRKRTNHFHFSVDVNTATLLKKKKEKRFLLRWELYYYLIPFFLKLCEIPSYNFRR